MPARRMSVTPPAGPSPAPVAVPSTSNGMSQMQLLIGGQWTAARSGREDDVTSPFDGAVVGSVPVAGRADVDAALTAAVAGAWTWRSTRRRYQPAGDRVVATYDRASCFGTDPGALDRADQEVLRIVQIESAVAVSGADEFAAIDGVDVLFVGPRVRMARPAGCSSEMEHPQPNASPRAGRSSPSALTPPCSLRPSGPSSAGPAPPLPEPHTPHRKKNRHGWTPHR